MIKYILVALTAGFLFTGSVNAQSTTGNDGTVVQTDDQARQEK